MHGRRRPPRRAPGRRVVRRGRRGPPVRPRRGLVAGRAGKARPPAEGKGRGLLIGGTTSRIPRPRAAPLDGAARGRAVPGERTLRGHFDHARPCVRSWAFPADMQRFRTPTRVEAWRRAAEQAGLLGMLGTGEPDPTPVARCTSGRRGGVRPPDGNGPGGDDVCARFERGDRPPGGAGRGPEGGRRRSAWSSAGRSGRSGGSAGGGRSSGWERRWRRSEVSPRQRSGEAHKKPRISAGVSACRFSWLVIGSGRAAERLCAPLLRPARPHHRFQ